MASNWHKKKGCFLLSSYREMKSRRGWTAATCEDTCTEQTFENQIYKFNKAVLISKVRAKSVSDCLETCTDQVRLSETLRDGEDNNSVQDGCVAVNFMNRKCLLLSKARALVSKDGWTAATCA